MTETAVSVIEHQASNHNLPGWLRVYFWCLAHADRHGHARAFPGQLRSELTFSSARDVSRALSQARERRLLDPCSTAACLVVPGNAIAPCEADHRETS